MWRYDTFWFAADKRGLSSFWGDKNDQEFILLINAIVTRKWDGPPSPDVITQSHWRIGTILCRKTSPILIWLGPSISFWEVQTTWLRDLRAHCMNSCHRLLKSFVFQSWFHCVSSFSVQKVQSYPSALQLVIHLPHSRQNTLYTVWYSQRGERIAMNGSLDFRA